MNALFLVSEALTDSNGISKKVLAQVNALEHHGLKVALCYLVANNKNEFIGRYIDGEVLDKYSGVRFISKIRWRYRYKNLQRYIKEQQIKLVYVRYTHFANPFFISFLKELKKNDIITLLELPSYPYDKEYQNVNFIDKVILLIERFSRRKFKNFITRVITLSHHTTIFKIPTIQISNGIDVNSVTMAEKRKPDNEIHLIGVASMACWHGYDRVIEGMNVYYSDKEPRKKKIFFHIVGDTSGREALFYKQLVEKYNLSNYVIFHGRKSGKELDMFFDGADIAVGSLGCHRIAMKYIKSLKSREYCARGMPFFYSATDTDFEDQDFILKVPANNDPIDINKVIDFVVNNNFDPAKIRNYAFENLTWEKQFEKVLQNVIANFKASPQLQTAT